MFEVFAQFLWEILSSLIRIKGISEFFCGNMYNKFRQITWNHGKMCAGEEGQEGGRDTRPLHKIKDRIVQLIIS